MKILVKINGDKLSFINRKKLNTEYRNMLNTNVISNDELVFSDAYIKENEKIVATFLCDLIKTYKLTTLSFQNIEVASIIFPFINKLKGISIINFESNEVLPYNFCEKLIKHKDLKYISASYIPAYMFEMLDKYDIIPESRNEILFTSNFMNINSLDSYSSLFYKNMIYIEFPLSEEDKEDFNTFCQINRHLRIIHVNEPNRFNLEEVINILKTNNHSNIKIVIHGNVNDPDAVEYLKKNNKIFEKKYKISFKLKYTDKYIRENILGQTNNNILRTIGLLMLFIVVLSIGYVFYDNYASMLKVTEIQDKIYEHITATDPSDTIEEIEKENGTTVVNDYIAALKSINPDVVGWLKVNNTNIDYAILQTINNEYYLNYNIYKEKDPNGWLFLDYENNSGELDDNNIIYGHNRYVNGVMFGTLRKTLYENWYKEKENQIITYDTLFGSYKFKIFSIYIINTTTDYITVNYNTDEEKMEFLKMIEERSIYDFNAKLNKNTKILTLSTCQSDTQRLVLHAYLIEE